MLGSREGFKKVATVDHPRTALMRRKSEHTIEQRQTRGKPRRINRRTGASTMNKK